MSILGAIVRVRPADLEEYVASRVERLLTGGGVPADLHEHPEVLAAVRGAIADDVRLGVTAPVPRALSCPVTSIVARDDTVVSRRDTAQWTRATRFALVETVLPGDHFFYRETPQVLARLVLGELSVLDGPY